MILLSHFGRPKGRDPTQSLKPVAPAIAEVLGRPVAFAEDCIGEKAAAAIDAMKPGDILCLENTRFHAGEETNDPAFVAQLAALGDIFVNDAFSAAHRAHASVEGLGRKLPTYAGRAMQDELDALTKVLETPTRPLAAIVGGAKVSTKLDLLGNLLAKVDVLVIGGGDGQHLSRRARTCRSASRCASTISCRPRARSWTRQKPKAARSCCRSMSWWPRNSRRMRPRAWSRSTTSPTTR